MSFLYHSISYTTNVFVLENMVQDRSMYLFKFPCGGNDINQRSRNGLFGGSSEIFVFYSGNHSFSLLRATWRKDSISTEQNYQEFLFQEKDQFGGIESSKRRQVPSRETDRLPDLWLLSGHWRQRFCIGLCRLIYCCLSKWQHSGVRYKIRRYFIFDWTIPTWWHPGKSVQIKNTRVGKIKTVLELYILETHQKKAKPDYHRLKTVVKRNIGQDHGILRLDMGELSQTFWSRIRGNIVAFSKHKEIVGMTSQRAVFKRMQMQFPGRWW